MSATVETCTGMNLSMTPPCCVARVGLAWRLATLTTSRMTRSRLGMARTTSAFLPLSLPDRTITWSPLWIFMSEHLRCERHDAHEALVAQLAADGPENAGPARLLLVIDENSGVLIEADVAAVGTTLFLLRAHDDALDDVAPLDGGTRDGVLDRGHEHIADAGVAPARPAEHADAEHLACAGVVGDPEPGFLLNHRARSTTSVRRQRLSLDRGRASCTRTRSPPFALSSASCTESFFVPSPVLPYLGWRTRSTTATTTVADMASDTTIPSRTLRRLSRGPSSSGAPAVGGAG